VEETLAQKDDTADRNTSSTRGGRGNRGGNGGHGSQFQGRGRGFQNRNKKGRVAKPGCQFNFYCAKY